MKISFIIPSRNNLRFLQQAYNSIRQNIKERHEIVMLDDASEDGTWNWLNEIKKTDLDVIIYRNNGPDRVGHTVLYDKGVELSTSDVFSIFHADMVATPNYVTNLTKHLTRGKVVCATRIEPPLHPSGVEKYIRNYGFDTDEFKEKDFLNEVVLLEDVNRDKVTHGIFAPWIMFKQDFVSIGGHDKLFAPMELEDSDIFNRMQLAGYELIQSRDAFCYHMTCRGSRFKDGLEIEQIIDLPDGTKWYKPKDSAEYTELRRIKFREWWRKWGQDVLHDEYMLPIIHPKYNIGFVVKNCTYDALAALEPWCDIIYTDLDWDMVKQVYIRNEQPNTMFGLYDRIYPYDNEKQTEIIVDIDMKKFNSYDMDIIRQLSAIIKNSGEIGDFELSNLKISIINLTENQNNLIKCNNNIF